MKRSELESILESKGLNKSVIPFFGGGVQVEINEGIASFRSINASALKHIQSQINEGGVISGQVLTYRLEESDDGDEDDEEGDGEDENSEDDEDE